MNLQKFFFKIFVTLTYLVRIFIIVFPIVWLIVFTSEGGWKYGFTFIQNTIEVALFIAFAIAFIFSSFHALSYEVVGEGPIENYLKVHQIVQVKGDISIDVLKDRMNIEPKKYKSLEVNGEKLEARKRVWFTPPDKVDVLKKGNVFEIQSRPFIKLWFMDFGRNYKNVHELARLIKRKE